MMRKWGFTFLLLGLVFVCLVAPANIKAAGTAMITGKVLESGSALPLLGVTIAAVGPTAKKTQTDMAGNFTLDGLTPGRYLLVATLNGYENTESEQFDLIDGQNQQVTLAIQRLPGVTSGIKTLGRTTIRASAALQTASVISATVPAQSLIKQSIYRAADALRRLPGVNQGDNETPALGDDIHLDIRGIGKLETIALLDGNPLGPGFTDAYNFQLSPVFGLRNIKVLYGSGSDLYGVNAIGGVIDMQTLEPTRLTSATVTQGYGTWNKLTTALTATGSTTSGKFGYAVALGTQGFDGPFRHDHFYQASAAFDPFATDPAVLATGIYEDDTGVTNKSTLLKGRMNFSDTSHLTATFLSGAYWEDKAGNGDNDYLPFEVALANGQNQLNNAIAANAATPGSDPCNAANPGQFQLPMGFNPNGSTPGIGPGGVPDGGSRCQTPRSFAQAEFGYQGSGPAWESFRGDDYSLRYDATVGKHSLSLNTFSNLYVQAYDRTSQLPFAVVPGDNAFWRNEQASDTGLTASDDILGVNNEFGFGYFWENSAFFFRLKGAVQPAPITHDTAFFVRDAWHPQHSDLTTYLNLWLKNSTITHTSFVDPRIALVYQKHDDVLRIAGGKTSAQPLPSQIVSLFSPTALGGFLGHIHCSGFNSVGNIPSSELKPEQGVDEEFSYGHRFAGDTTAQLSIYNENVFSKIYNNLTLPLSTLTVPFDPTPYVNLVASNCGVTPAQALALLGVSGSINIGHVAARGIDLTGRVRVARPFFIDYGWSTESSVLLSNDPSLINPVFGGNLTLIPGSQLPNVPLHKWSVNLDYTFGHNVETQFVTYHVSENNQRDLPAYTYSNMTVSVPIGQGLLSTTVNNVFQNYADYRDFIGEGYPLALNSFAQPSDYRPFFGAQATEHYGLPFRTIEFTYSLRVK